MDSKKESGFSYCHVKIRSITETMNTKHGRRYNISYYNHKQLQCCFILYSTTELLFTFGQYFMLFDHKAPDRLRFLHNKRHKYIYTICYNGAADRGWKKSRSTYDMAKRFKIIRDASVELSERVLPAVAVATAFTHSLS